MATDRGYHIAVDVDDANGFIYAITNCFKTVIETVAAQQLSLKEKLAAGVPVSAKEVFATKAEANEQEPEPNTVRVDADILESIHHLADALEKARDAIPTTVECENEDFALKGYVLDLTGSIHTLIRCAKK